jgi:hypothetical protein
VVAPDKDGAEQNVLHRAEAAIRDARTHGAGLRI